MRKGIIFDLDGTLADTLSSIAYFANRALMQNGFPKIPVEEYRYLVGNGAKRLVHGMLRSVGADTEENYAKVAPLYNDSYDADALYLTKPYDGILPLLDHLREKDVITAVLSNKPDRTTQKIVKALFGDRILFCRGQRDDTPRKPIRQAYTVCLRKCGFHRRSARMRVIPEPICSQERRRDFTPSAYCGAFGTRPSCVKTARIRLYHIRKRSEHSF